MSSIRTFTKKTGKKLGRAQRATHSMSRWKRTAVIGVVLACVFGVGVLSVVSPPPQFPAHHIVTIKKGLSLSEIASTLKQEHVIASALVFETATMLFGGAQGAQAGAYYFNTPDSITTVAYRVSHGLFGVDPVKVTIPEGATVADMAAILTRDIPDFDTNTFLAVAKPKEGYLFPDTYFFSPTATPQDVVDEMYSTFQKKISTIAPLVAQSGHSLSNIVTMASIVEKEAHMLSDKKLVSGILWKRIDIGMPLQVDAPFVYLEGKGSSQLTTTDLATTSPYNTYVHKGLPPTPISNPGIDSLIAAADPTSSPYLFYLSDSGGDMHYAQTFDQHKVNKAKYLN